MSAREELLEPQITPAPSRPNDLITLPKRVDVGSQVIGSSHLFRAGQLENIGMLPLFVAIEERQPSPFAVANPLAHSATLEPQSAPKPLDILFSPTLATIGEQRSVLAVHATRMSPSGSNVTDVHEIELVGRGKHPGELPAESERPKLRAPESVGTMPLDNMPTKGLINFEFYADRAAAALSSLRAIRQNKVREVERNVASFKPKEPKGSFWLDMAELALTLASVGIASAASARIGAEFAKGFLKDEEKKLAEKVMGDVVKEGLKTGGKAGAGRLVSQGSSEQGATGPDQFFAVQDEALDEQAYHHDAMVSNAKALVRELARSDPHAATEAMRTIAEHLVAEREIAGEIQKQATSSQWAVALAKASSGSNDAAQPTPMDKTRHDEQPAVVARSTEAAGMRLGHVQGVMRIDVALLDKLGDRPSRFAVKAAAIHGISKTIGGDLATARLAAMPIPVLLVLNHGLELLRISRDEVGNVEISSGIDGKTDPRSLQLHRAAKVLVDEVLSIPLAERGIAVKTDDV